jgi:hypothetical protein
MFQPEYPLKADGVVSLWQVHQRPCLILFDQIHLLLPSQVPIIFHLAANRSSTTPLSVTLGDDALPRMFFMVEKNRGVSHAPTRAPMSKSGMAVGGETNSIVPGGMLVAGVHMPESMPHGEDYPLPASTWAARAGICMPPTSEDGPCVGECASPAGN